MISKGVVTRRHVIRVLKEPVNTRERGIGQVVTVKEMNLMIVVIEWNLFYIGRM
jgi:hypothetical protein